MIVMVLSVAMNQMSTVFLSSRKGFPGNLYVVNAAQAAGSFQFDKFFRVL